MNSFAPLTWRTFVASIFFAIAFVVDTLTARQWSSVFGGLAIAASVLVVLPIARRLAAPLAAYTAIWTLFVAGRGRADEVDWREDTVGVVPRLETSALGGDSSSAWTQQIVHGLPRAELFESAAIVVYLSFFVVPHIVAAVLLLRNRTQLWRFAAALALLFAVGLLGFALLPTNPPWLAEGQPGGGVDRIVPSKLAEIGIETGASDPLGSPERHSFESNSVASWPSIHLGVTALLVPFAATWTRRGIAIAYTLAMAIALVFLGEHYALDVVAGGIAAAFAWRVTTSVVAAATTRTTRTAATDSIGARPSALLLVDPGKVRDDLDVVGLREHVKPRHAIDAVPGDDESLQVAGERRRVA